MVRCSSVRCGAGMVMYSHVSVRCGPEEFCRGTVELSIVLCSVGKVVHSIVSKRAGRV